MKNKLALSEQTMKLACTPDILSVFDEEILKSGFAGETHIPRLVYLTLFTGMLKRPVSLVIKGPSGAGKSFALNMAKQFIPDTAYEEFSGMSEKALVYLKDLDLQHKHLIIGEAAGMAEGNGRTLLRQLLSEGKVTYATVQSTNKGLSGEKLPEVKGPCGLIMTTTSTGLHLEDESRMLSVQIIESKEQIVAALQSQALGGNRDTGPIDVTAWHELYNSIRNQAPMVEIPYAPKIVPYLPSSSDKIKRDFPQVLSLISACALLHSATRDRDSEGRIIASEADYATVRELVNKPISEGLGATVSDTSKRLIEAVSNLAQSSQEDVPFDVPHTPVSLSALATALERDRTVVGRTLKKAISEGYLVDQNPGQGKESIVTLGERKLPSGDALPSPEELFGVVEPA